MILEIPPISSALPSLSSLDSLQCYYKSCFLLPLASPCLYHPQDRGVAEALPLAAFLLIITPSPISISNREDCSVDDTLCPDSSLCSAFLPCHSIPYGASSSDDFSIQHDSTLTSSQGASHWSLPCYRIPLGLAPTRCHLGQMTNILYFITYD